MGKTILDRQYPGKKKAKQLGIKIKRRIQVILDEQRKFNRMLSAREKRLMEKRGKVKARIKRAKKEFEKFI